MDLKLGPSLMNRRSGRGRVTDPDGLPEDPYEATEPDRGSDAQSRDPGPESEPEPEARSSGRPTLASALTGDGGGAAEGGAFRIRDNDSESRRRAEVLRQSKSARHVASLVLGDALRDQGQDDAGYGGFEDDEEYGLEDDQAEFEVEDISLSRAERAALTTGGFFDDGDDDVAWADREGDGEDDALLIDDAEDDEIAVPRTTLSDAAAVAPPLAAPPAPRAAPSPEDPGTEPDPAADQANALRRLAAAAKIRPTAPPVKGTPKTDPLPAPPAAKQAKPQAAPPPAAPATEAAPKSAPSKSSPSKPTITRTAKRPTLGQTLADQAPRSRPTITRVPRPAEPAAGGQAAATPPPASEAVTPKEPAPASRPAVARVKPAEKRPVSISRTATIPAGAGTGAPPAPQARPKPPPARSRSPHEMARLGEQLVSMGLISKDQLRVAVTEQKQRDAQIGQVLVDLGFVTEQTLSEVLARNTGRDQFDPEGTVPDPGVFQRLPEDVARRLRVMPVALEGQVLRLAMADALDVVAQDEVRTHFGADTRIEPLVAAESHIHQAIDDGYGHTLSLDGVLREVEALDADAATMDDRRGGAFHPVVRLVNILLLDAVKRRASDLHFEPDGAFLRVRLRIDGVMTQVLTFHKQYWPAVAQRVKILAGMNIADRMSPQDGRFSLTVAHRKVDVRASALPTVHGENIVLRILDRSATPLRLGQLGFDPDNLDLLRRLLRRPEGMVLVTGPTGSGKTTTLYAMMDYIGSSELNIMTLEDPVEYEMPMIRQSQVRDGGRVGFADGIRAILRQDPDVILVGEIRDPDTAGMALRAAMTGHQLYATLHTSDAAGALPRLTDLGLKPGMLAGNVIGIVAQRLARRLCPACREMKTADPRACAMIGADPGKPPEIGHAKGCEACGHTGYRGRVAITEVLPVVREVDDLIAAGASLGDIRAAAARHGYKPMIEDGSRKVLEGLIDVPSLVRAVDITSRLL